MPNLPLPPGNLGLPIVGETLSFLFDRDMVAKRYRQYGPIFKSRLLGRPTVFMVGPEAVEFVLSKGMEHFSWREGWPDNFKQLLGDSLFVQDGEEHRRNRRLMMPALHGQALAGYIETMEARARRYCQQWQEKQELVWFHEFKQLTFEIASELLLGTKASDEGDEVARLSQLFTTLTNGLFALNPLPLPWTTFQKALRARDELLDHLTQVVAERKQQPSNDVLGMLVQAEDEDGNRMSERQLRDQAMLLLFAGHETTTAMLTWFCLELARHPDILEKARSEQQQLSNTGALTLEQLGQMPYLEQIFSEIERLHPPVGGGFRGVIKPFEFNGYCVPEGWLVNYSIITTHSLPEIYPHPQQFDPERFNPTAKNQRPPFSLIGFGGGPRLCIGIAFAKLEMKIIAAQLLRGYQWELLPGQSLEPVAVPTRHPKDWLRVRFTALT